MTKRERANRKKERKREQLPRIVGIEREYQEGERESQYEKRRQITLNLWPLYHELEGQRSKHGQAECARRGLIRRGENAWSEQKKGGIGVERLEATPTKKHQKTNKKKKKKKKHPPLGRRKRQVERGVRTLRQPSHRLKKGRA